MSTSRTPRRVVAAVRNRVAALRAPGGRQAGLDDEIAYWKDWLETKGGEWPDSYRRRLDPATVIEDEALADALPDTDPVRILDVGSGPLTSVGQKTADGRQVDVTATDVLADAYNELLREAGVAPLTPTIRCRGEDLRTLFSPDSFDVAYSRNALDHAEDPALTIRNMLELAPVVVLRHYRNEAEELGGRGLHQWNFDLVDDRPVVAGEGTVTELGTLGTVERAWLEPNPHSPWVVCRLTR